MSGHRRIVITGFMGSGKTTLAQALAERLNFSGLDLDQIITERERRSPGEIIEEDGEAAFRDLETHALSTVMQSGFAFVLALGGGAWALERNRKLIREQNALTIWLDVPFELCWQRIAAAGNRRPLASDQQTALNLYKLRWPLYRLAEFHLRADAEDSADDLVAEINQSILNQAF